MRTFHLYSSILVELQGLEPWTSSMPWKRSSQLSYSPVLLITIIIPDKELKGKLVSGVIVKQLYNGTQTVIVFFDF